MNNLVHFSEKMDRVNESCPIDKINPPINAQELLTPQLNKLISYEL